MDEESFTQAVDEGLNLAKRVYAGKDRSMVPPRPKNAFEARPVSLLPSGPTVYAVISDPAVVDNPDVPSYQPHVYGRCEPPALIPLQMNGVDMQVDCHVDTAVVSVSGRWRVHCVMRSRRCDCRLVVPMGDQGSILGVEVDVARRSYSTRVVQIDEDQKIYKIDKSNGGFLKPHLFFITIPQVDGGCEISLKVSWSQKLLYKDGQFAVNVPFNFPDYVNPFVKIFSKREKIQLNVNSCTGKEVVLQRTSHPLKEKGRHVGSMSFLYEADVEHWSKKDFHFSYSIYSNNLFGGVLLQSPSMQDYDQREMFYLYLFPGNSQNRKVFRREVVFLVDISGSMRGKPLENVKNALSAAILELTPTDSFNIIAFNEELYSFSSSMEPATEDMIENATQWISKNFVAEGGTNIMQPLNEAMELLSKTQDSLPHIFLITDGSVEDERDICGAMRTQVANRGSMAPRISSFGIGTFCNHYFLQMLSLIGKGHYEASYDPDSTDVRMRRWFRRGLSPVLADISVDIFDHLNENEVFPSHIPDLSVGCPLIISGRFEGKFPDSVKAKGRVADMSNIVVDLKVKNTKDIPLEKVCAKQQIDLLTAQAWFSGSKQLEDKVVKLSVQTGIPSEYTYMILLEDEEEKQDTLKQPKKDKRKRSKSREQVTIQAHEMTVGFGSIIATAENLPTGYGEPKPPPETFAVLNKAVGCCSSMCDCCCCMCVIKTCSKLNDQCVIALTQLCTALSCFGCFECCSELCCSDE
ncbi:inter alpha-trypsin inhibitor, heavy chain 4-like [Iris pallida]|uniref:Inter alpha-trypsin inhibitor, heavy chain 4-like n=1 Tax=Iris pallida TaxID=29817 RepID=A0AAX6HW73_IRIPA|nr:inter alpha-trypsin inhibitor, heavy chain 4-like [Iris pallida]